MSSSSDSDASDYKREIVQATSEILHTSADNAVASVDAEQTSATSGSGISAGRAKLQSWLYRELRIQLTDGRILKGNFLCTDADANVILGMCMEDTEKGGEVRMLGLVMVPGRHIVKMEMEDRIY